MSPKYRHFEKVRIGCRITGARSTALNIKSSLGILNGDLSFFGHFQLSRLGFSSMPAIEKLLGLSGLSRNYVFQLKPEMTLSKYFSKI